MCIGSKVTPTDGEINSLFVGKVLLQIIYRWPTLTTQGDLLINVVVDNWYALAQDVGLLNNTMLVSQSSRAINFQGRKRL